MLDFFLKNTFECAQTTIMGLRFFGMPPICEISNSYANTGFNNYDFFS